MNKAGNAKTQKQIDTLTHALIKAKSKLAKGNLDLKISKVQRVGNSYLVKIKNTGKDISTKTRLLISCGCEKFKKVKVKAIACENQLL